MVFDQTLGVSTEPLPVERERALGITAGDTNVPGLKEAQRNSILGNCMDMQALTHLWAIAETVSAQPPVAQVLVHGAKDETQQRILPPLGRGKTHADPVDSSGCDAPWKASRLRSTYGIGAQIVVADGWKHGRSLGLSGGICWPLSAQPEASRGPNETYGLGWNPECTTDGQDTEVRWFREQSASMAGSPVDPAARLVRTNLTALRVPASRSNRNA